ncbi:DUF2254 domain-containing protein [Pontibacter harenae]|uniref:DUF2254 domain-containing protein n=1 Tax=Pontibacter harenae TaxID=2894083 RepID=UPI001E458400|nr:DUF2254 domain-containing protein [Pontibacter harenae]MCC9167699.1 DUF2254 domain-containing protein [Pontibacter harenae]
MKTAKLKYSAKKGYKQIITSIAFYPTLISLGMLVTSWGTNQLDKASIGGSIMRVVPFLQIDNADTARSLLSSLLTGLITLVTFTFTMVMVVLTQVTSNFSPRLLPDLLNQKGSQIVMGSIIGTVCFIIITLTNVETMQSGPKVPLFSVVLAMFMSFVSLISFIYFIHRVSNDVQIGNILNDIYTTVRDNLSRELDSGSYHEVWEEDEEFRLVKAWDSGYFDTITKDEFKKSAEKKGLKVRLLVNQGTYLLKGEPFLEINLPLDDEVKEILEENVLLRHQEIVQENFLYGFKHLTEIAVKGLSPGVNDPGTAIHAIDYMMDLLCRLQQLKGQKVIKQKDGTACIIYAPVPFERTFYLCTASIRAYSTQDVAVQARLIDLISKVSARDEQDLHKSLLEKELKSIEEASIKDMKAQEDIDFIKVLLRKARLEHMS